MLTSLHLFFLIFQISIFSLIVFTLSFSGSLCPSRSNCNYILSYLYTYSKKIVNVQIFISTSYKISLVKVSYLLSLIFTIKLKHIFTLRKKLCVIMAFTQMV